MADEGFEDLLQELRDVAERADPVPDAVLGAAKDAFIWRTVDTEIAQLLADSAAPVGAAGVRSGAPPRLLTFQGPGLEVEIEVADTGPTRRLTGQVVPPGPVHIVVRTSAAALDIDADEMGRFTVGDVASGAVSLLVSRVGDAGHRHEVATSWVSI
jgi:hypothetical protein